LAHERPHKDKHPEADEPIPVSGKAEAAAGAPPVDDPPSEEAVLGEQLRKLTAEKEELLNTLVRRQADFDNFRKRVEKERLQERHKGIEYVIEQLLPVLDAFDNALVSASSSGSATEYSKGFELIRRQLWDVLAKQGVARIESVGKEFDPHVHHAIAKVETGEHADGTVVSELQPGYTLHGRILRPAMVRVASEPEKAAKFNN
jgi:molecular chaperone GrpE